MEELHKLQKARRSVLKLILLDRWRGRVENVELTEKESKLAEKTYNESQGMIGVEKISECLTKLGQRLSTSELKTMLESEGYDCSISACLGQEQWRSLLLHLKRNYVRIASQEDSDSLEAFISLGGRPNKKGSIATSKLRNVINTFELDIDIDNLINELDEQNDGVVTFEEFTTLLRGRSVPPQKNTTYKEQLSIPVCDRSFLAVDQLQQFSELSKLASPRKRAMKMHDAALTKSNSLRMISESNKTKRGHCQKYFNDYIDPGTKKYFDPPRKQSIRSSICGTENVFTRLGGGHKYHPHEVLFNLHGCLNQLVAQKTRTSKRREVPSDTNVFQKSRQRSKRRKPHKRDLATKKNPTKKTPAREGKIIATYIHESIQRPSSAGAQRSTAPCVVKKRPMTAPMTRGGMSHIHLVNALRDARKTFLTSPDEDSEEDLLPPPRCTPAAVVGALISAVAAKLKIPNVKYPTLFDLGIPSGYRNPPKDLSAILPPRRRGNHIIS